MPGGDACRAPSDDAYANWHLLHRLRHDRMTADETVAVFLTMDRLIEEWGEGEPSRPVYAARRFAASVMQLGGPWGALLDHLADLDANARGDEGIPAKRWRLEASGAACRDAQGEQDPLTCSRCR